MDKHRTDKFFIAIAEEHIKAGMLDEAMREFEHVVQVSPDNLLAHRKLVSIYKDIGRFDDAIKACEILLVFNPKDKEIADLLSNLMREKMEKVSQHERTTGEDSITSSPRQCPRGFERTPQGRRKGNLRSPRRRPFERSS